MKIAFCDDGQTYLSLYADFMVQIESLVSDVDYEEFISGKLLLEEYNETDARPYDIVFLDIEMDGYNGIEVAKKIRLFDENVIIIFVTSHTNYVYEAFEVSPLRFLVKPVEFKSFKEIFLVAYEKLKKNNSAIFLNISNDTVRLNCGDIYYIESSRKILIFHTNSGEIRAYGKLNDYADRLYQNDFIRVHKSYLVNYNHVKKFSFDALVIINGDIIPISENNRRYAKDESLKFVLRSYKTNDR
jgi:DNA-binding LytR/AlgR family response regulator